MATPAFLLREFFHLSFLRIFSLRLAGRAYSVKGGICLRFFHASPRLSEDMDLDADPGIRSDTLAKGVDTVLDGEALRSQLATRGISGLRVTKPKQTGVTQRWKISLDTQGGPVGTKIEFSRRTGKIPAVEGVPTPDILRMHGCMPFAARFYEGGEMARQKTLALAASGRNAARDLFDLHHLLHFRQIPTRSLKGLGVKILGEAAQKAAGFSFGDFREQVLPYLSEEMMDAYATGSAYAVLRNRVTDSLQQAAE